MATNLLKENLTLIICYLLLQIPMVLAFYFISRLDWTGQITLLDWVGLIIAYQIWLSTLSFVIYTMKQDIIKKVIEE